MKKAQLLQREAMIAEKAMRRSPTKRREKVLKFTSSEAESEQAFLSYWATLSEQQARLDLCVPARNYGVVEWE